MEYRNEWVRGDAAGEALEIRRQVYMEEFGFVLGGSGPGDAIDRRAHHLVTRTTAGEPVASLRLLDAAARPFEVEQFLDIGVLLATIAHPAEITRLCIRAPYRRITHASFVHLAVLRAVIELTRQLGVTHIVAWTRQELLPFYKYALFDAHDLGFAHPGIGGARHTVVTLDLAAFPERCRVQRPTLYGAVADVLAEGRVG